MGDGCCCPRQLACVLLPTPGHVDYLSAARNVLCCKHMSCKVMHHSVMMLKYLLAALRTAQTRLVVCWMNGYQTLSEPYHKAITSPPLFLCLALCCVVLSGQ